MSWVLWVYLLIGIISLLALIAMLALGGLDALGLDFDVGDIDVDADIDAGQGVGPLSIPIILCFLSAFGGLGALSLVSGASEWMSPIIATAGAFIMAALIFMGLQLFLRMFTSDSTVSIRSLKGETGTVSVPIRPGSEGQIVVITPQRGRTLLAAVADKSIPRNAKVKIIGTSGDVVKVKIFKGNNIEKRRRGDRK